MAKEKKIPVPDGKERVVHRGRMIEVVEQDMIMPSGKKKTFEFARRSPGTRMIIVSADGQIMLTKEFRTETGNFDYRLPGGKVFDTLDEYNAYLKSGADILLAAETGVKNEAEQEAGIRIKSMQHIHTSKCGATVVWDLYYFVVNDYEELANQNLEEGENIERVWVTKDEARDICISGQMQEDRSVSALLRFLEKEV